MNFADNPNVEPKTYPELDKLENISEKQHLSDVVVMVCMMAKMEEWKGKEEKERKEAREKHAHDEAEHHFRKFEELVRKQKEFENNFDKQVKEVNQENDVWKEKKVAQSKFARKMKVACELKTGAESDEEAMPIQEDETGKRTVKGNGNLKMPAKTRRMSLKRGVTVDSGASANVMPRRMIGKRSRIRPSEGSRRGAHYIAANSGRIPNEGEFDFKFTTTEGTEQSMVFQVAEVNKALGSISYLVDNGYRVTFDQDEKTGADISMMYHKKTGVTTRFRRQRNIWILDAFVDVEDVPEPFGRLA